MAEMVSRRDLNILSYMLNPPPDKIQEMRDNIFPVKLSVPGQAPVLASFLAATNTDNTPKTLLYVGLGPAKATEPHRFSEHLLVDETGKGRIYLLGANQDLYTMRNAEVFEVANGLVYNSRWDGISEGTLAKPRSGYTFRGQDGSLHSTIPSAERFIEAQKRFEALRGSDEFRKDMKDTKDNGLFHVDTGLTMRNGMPHIDGGRRFTQLSTGTLLITAPSPETSSMVGPIVPNAPSETSPARRQPGPPTQIIRP